MVLVHDDVAGAQVGERAQRARAGGAPRRALRRAAAAEQPVLGDHRELQLRRDEAVAQPGVGEAQRRGVGAVAAPSSQLRLQAPEVVGGALALAAAGQATTVAVARAHELLELGLGLLERARGDVGGLRAELDRLVVVDAR